jgi:O-antigen/teichoic acid export membrane protein
LRGSVFFRNLGLIAGASASSFAISLLLTPLMTRVYGPADYGSFAVVNNLATFIASLSLLSLPNVLPLEAEPHRRRRVLRTLLYVLSASVIATLVATIATVAVGLLLGNRGLAWSAILLLPVLVAAIALQSGAQGLAIAESRFKAISRAKLLHPLIAKPGAIAAALAIGPQAAFILAFEALGFLVQARTMTGSAWRSLLALPMPFSARRFAVAVEVVKRNRGITLFDNLSNLSTLAAASLQSLVVAHGFSLADAGHFSLALSIASLPAQLIALATAPVIYHKLIETNRHAAGHMLRRVLGIIAAYLVVGIAPYLVLLLFGPQLFLFAFGGSWGPSGQAASILSVPMLLHFAALPVTAMFRVSGRVALGLAIDLGMLSVVLASFLVACVTLPFLQAVQVLAAGLSLYRLMQLAACARLAWRMSESSLAAGPAS